MGEGRRFRGWTPLRGIEFGESLALLQGMMGLEVRVLVNLPGYFFDCAFSTRLERVESLGRGNGPVLVVFGGPHGLALDPGESQAFLAGAEGRGGRWLEFHVSDRARVAIEPLEEVPRRGEG